MTTIAPNTTCERLDCTAPATAVFDGLYVCAHHATGSNVPTDEQRAASLARTKAEDAEYNRIRGEYEQARAEAAQIQSNLRYLTSEINRQSALLTEAEADLQAKRALWREAAQH